MSVINGKQKKFLNSKCNISSTYFQRAVRELEINLNADLHLILLVYLGNEEEQMRLHLPGKI